MGLPYCLQGVCMTTHVDILVCVIGYCRKPAYKEGFCLPHFRARCRWSPRSMQERFFAHVRISTNQEECWEWTGGVSGGTGYGSFNRGRDEQGKKSYASAHRIAFELSTGESIPPGMFVCHRCDNRLCINSSHLFLGTALDNNLDMKALDAWRFRDQK